MTRMPSFIKKTLRIRGSRSSALDTARSRIVMISAAFVLCYILVGARVFDLSMIQGRLHPLADVADYTAAGSDAPRRADILDRNGVILATSLDTASLYADPALIIDPVDTAEGLSKIFPDLVYGDVLQKLQRHGRFVWIKRNLTPGEQFKVLELGDPGLDFRTERHRIYPQGDLAAHFVGYTDVDGNGLGGVERSFNDLLAKGGDPLTMTIDIRLQHILHREIKRAMTEFTGKAAAGAIVDIANGQVLAAVSMPDFDPNDTGDAKQIQFFNNLTLGVFEMGSTFKIFSTAALLENKNPPMEMKFDTDKPLKRGRFTISDYHPEKRKLTIPEIFMLSSNIGAALEGELVGTDALKDFYRDLGLMDPLQIEINEIGRPLLPPVWRDINTLTASFGHGIAVSPLQMVMAASGIVNGGVLVKPTLIMNENDKKMSQDNPEVRIVSPQTAHRMRQMMRLVVTDGTGTKANVPGYNVGGKTGTAEKKKIDGKGYDAHRKLSSFIGFFPMDAPRYAVFVMVDEPHGTKETFGYATGGWVAAPAVARVIASMGPLLGIEPEHDTQGNDVAASLRKVVTYNENSEKEKARVTY